MPNPSNSSTQVPVAVTQRILARTRATHGKLRPQVALVVRALNASGHPGAGGFSAQELETPLPLKAAKVVEVLQATFGEDAAVAAQLSGVIAEFQQATEALDAVDAALKGGAGPSDAQVQDLKNAAYFVSKFHESVKNDALLAQLFPSPEVLQADARHAQ